MHRYSCHVRPRSSFSHSLPQRRRWRPNLEWLESRDLPSASPVQPIKLAATVTPNDTYYARYQWDMAKVSAPAAWAVTTGSTRVTVADIDSGVDYTAPDLYQNVWINQGEIPTDLRAKLVDVDQDGLITFRDLNNPANSAYVSDLNHNGYIDAGDILQDPRWMHNTDLDGNGYVNDIVGWNFANNTNNPFDGNDHGTHTFGTIGAVGNNGVGVAGLAWNVQIMPLKFIADDGSGNINWAVQAIQYSEMMGAQVANNSWVYYGGSPGDALYSAIAAAPNELFVAAAGNDGLNDDISIHKVFPASYDLPNIISVTATGSNDSKPVWADYGKASVDLGAPGVNVLSTLPGGQYGFGSGTSMAAPHVSGAAALILSQYPDLSAADVKSAILQGVDPDRALAGITVTGGRLDVAKALQIAGTLSATSTASTSGTTGHTTAGNSSGTATTASIDALLQLNSAETGAALIDRSASIAVLATAANQAATQSANTFVVRTPPTGGPADVNMLIVTSHGPALADANGFGFRTEMMFTPATAPSGTPAAALPDGPDAVVPAGQPNAEQPMLPAGSQPPANPMPPAGMEGDGNPGSDEDSLPSETTAPLTPLLADSVHGDLPWHAAAVLMFSMLGGQRRRPEEPERRVKRDLLRRDED